MCRPCSSANMLNIFIISTNYALSFIVTPSVPESTHLTDEFKRPVDPCSDSDYHSMTSSQSNSTESLDNLVERAMSDPNCLTAQLDFGKLLPIHYAKQERRGSAGNFSQLAKDNNFMQYQPRLYQRRNSFLTDHLIRNAKALHIEASYSVDYSEKYDDHQGLTAFSKGPKAVLVRPANIAHHLDVPQVPQAFSQMTIPNMMYLPPPSPRYPIFDPTKPPPVLVHRGMNFVSPRYTVLTRNKQPPADVEKPTQIETVITQKVANIEYYRPREMREITTPAPATDVSEKPTKTLSEPKFNLVQPVIDVTNKIGHIFESKPKPVPSRPSKIAANFSEQPQTPPPSVKSKVKDPFPALLPEPSPQRYIVPPKLPATSLAAIVRMAPHAPPQQRMILTKSEPTKPPGGSRPASLLSNTGMLNVNTWLKSLRLHKYQWLFADMTYEKMLAVNEEYLERLSITKGARNKLVISIQKLHDRVKVLDKVEKDLSTEDILLGEAIDEIVLVAQTPMLPASTTDPTNIATKLVNILTMGMNNFV